MTVQLNQQQVMELKKEGHTDFEIQMALQEVNKEVSMQDQYNYTKSQQKQTPPMQTSTFQYVPTDNLIKWQLELNDILERAEHILREDIVMITNGIPDWHPNPYPERRVFSEYGVQEIMRILSMYINRNTILSDYEPQEINDTVFDIGKEINDLLFMKYEDFGLTTLEKRKNYPMLHREIIDMIRSAYKRAQYGSEQKSLRTARSIQQQENIMPPNVNINTGEMRRERSMLNPARYLGGRYK